MASCSAIRNRLYVALREGMSPEGLKSSLQSAGLSIGGVAEVDAFDERVLAFL